MVLCNVTIPVQPSGAALMLGCMQGWLGAQTLLSFLCGWAVGSELVFIVVEGAVFPFGEDCSAQPGVGVCLRNSSSASRARKSQDPHLWALEGRM